MIHVEAPPSCSQCGDTGYDAETPGYQCPCGGSIRATHLALLRMHYWHARVDEEALPLVRWRLHRITDDETDDRGYTFSSDSIPFSTLADAVQKLCEKTE